jgi:hypothetical protein
MVGMIEPRRLIVTTLSFSRGARRDLDHSRLNEAGITTPRGHGKWSPVQVKRTLEALKDAEGLVH